MYLTRRTYLGLAGGALIMLAVFLTGTGVNFDTKALNVTSGLLLFVAGLGVFVWARLGRRTLVAYSAVSATTIGLILVIDLLRAGALDLTVKLVVLVVGIVLALMSSIGGDLMTYIAPTREVSVTTLPARSSTAKTGTSRSGAAKSGSARTGTAKSGTTTRK